MNELVKCKANNETGETGWVQKSCTYDTSFTRYLYLWQENEGSLSKRIQGNNIVFWIWAIRSFQPDLINGDNFPTRILQRDRFFNYYCHSIVFSSGRELLSGRESSWRLVEIPNLECHTRMGWATNWCSPAMWRLDSPELQNCEWIRWG